MPGFDKTGPQGMGPMTGGTRGYCAAPAGTASGFVGQGRAGGWGRGFGLNGRGRGGMGMGMGRRGFGYQNVGAMGAVPLNTPMTETQERSELQRQAQYIQSELEQIQNRITQMDESSVSDA